MGGVRTDGEKGAVPPFLSKCYEMVDDPATDDTVSWGKDGTSFVVWDPHTFSRDLLPKYFKHRNLSSFVRQLNTYGFYKADHDRWEFANQRFLRGQKHLLETIVRRKPSQNHAQPQQPQAATAPTNACVEVGKFGLEEEIERLKRDRNLLRQELVKLRQHQQNSENQLHDLRQRLQGMEQNQQQMLSFLAMAVQSPGFLAQVVQQNGNSRQWTTMNKKRRLPAPEHGLMDGAEAASDGQIVRYHPSVAEALQPLVTPVPSPDISTDSESTPKKINSLCANVDDMSLGPGLGLPPESQLLQPETFTSYLEALLASPKADDNEPILSHDFDASDFIMDFDFLDQDIPMDALEKEGEK